MGGAAAYVEGAAGAMRRELLPVWRELLGLEQGYIASSDVTVFFHDQGEYFFQIIKIPNTEISTLPTNRITDLIINRFL